MYPVFHNAINIQGGFFSPMVKLRLLGGTGLQGHSDEEVLPILSHPKRMAVLTYLALAARGGYVRRDVLLGLFWENSDQGHARNALSQVLHVLRRELGAEVLRRRGKQEVGLDPKAFTCDVWQFRDALEAGGDNEALQEYGGELLPGFYVGEAGAFEHWLQEGREQLRELAAAAAWRTAHAQLEGGDLVAAERTAQRALGLVWSDETPVRGFIHALAAAGDRTAALNFFEKFRSRLLSELELEPTSQTLQLVTEIREGDGFGEGMTAGAQERGTAQPPPASPETSHDLQGLGISRKGTRAHPLLFFAAGVLVIALGLTFPGLIADPLRAPPPSRPFTVLARVEGNADADLRQAVAFLIRTGLEMAGMIRPLPQSEVVETLGFLDRDSDGGPPGWTSAREVGGHLGIGTVVLPRLDCFGDKYVLAVRVEDARGGTLRAESRRVADGEAGLPDLVDRVVRKLRRDLGETRDALASTRPLATVTTSNPEALLLFSRAGQAFVAERDRPKAVALLEEALARDSTFALAWRMLGVYLDETKADPQRTLDALTRAFRFSHRVSEEERLRIHVQYHNVVEGDLEKAIIALERLIDLNPRTGWNNLAQLYRLTGRYDQAFSAMERALENGVSDLHTENYIQEALILRKIDAARWGLRLRSEHLPDNPRNPVWEAEVAYAAGDRGEVRRIYQSALEHAGDLWHENLYRDLLNSLDLLEGRPSSWDASTSVPPLRRAEMELFVRRRPGKVEALVTEALEGAEYEDLPPLNRPYLKNARSWAMAGRAREAEAAMAAWDSIGPLGFQTRNRKWALNSRGWVALARGEVTDGLELLRQAAVAGHGIPRLAGDLAWAYDRAQMPDSALVAYHRYLEAPDWGRLSWSGSWDRFHLARTFERLGQLHEDRGEMQEAARYHALFIELWSHAEEDLQPRVEAARDALGRLKGEG
jgi:serine/threonine-protein kinase